MRNTLNSMLGIARILLAMLREVFDEAPYARFLARTQTSSSPEAYAAFCREQESGRLHRTRCC